MNASTRNFFGRGMRIFQTLMIFPLALILMVIPLEIALGAHLLSLSLRNANWKFVGACCDVFAVVLTLIVAVAIVRLLLVWPGHVVRTIRGVEKNLGRADI